MNEENSPEVDMIEDAQNLLNELDGIVPVNMEEDIHEEETQHLDVIDDEVDLEEEHLQARDQEENESEVEGSYRVFGEDDDGEDEEETRTYLYDFKDDDIVVMKNGSSEEEYPNGTVLKVTRGYGLCTNDGDLLIKLKSISPLYEDVGNKYVNIINIRLATVDEIKEYIADREVYLGEKVVEIQKVIDANKGNVKEMKKSLTEMFGDNWDIVENIVDYSYVLSLVLKFPEITIKNGRGGSRTIYDLFIKLEFNEKLNVTLGMHGRRGAVSYSEFKSGYRHSHLPTSRTEDSEDISNVCSWKDFCLGNSETSTIQREWRVDRDSVVGEKFNIIQFELFMYQIEAYAGWESLGGGPYIRMENVHDCEGVTKVNNYLLQRMYASNIGLLKNFKVSFDKAINRFIVDKDALESRLTKMGIGGENVQKTGDGKYIYNSKANLDDILLRISQNNNLLTKDENGDNTFLFRGEPAPTYILEYNVDEKETSTAEEVIHPDITNYFANKLEGHINHYFIKKYGK